MDILERLASLRVSDVMSTDVVQIGANVSMDRAAQLMCERGVSAAPAIDEQGRCVGMLSAADFLHRACNNASSSLGDMTPVSRHENGPLACDREATEYVHRFMTAAVQSVSPRSSLIEAAGIMYKAHVHRLPVLDFGGRPVGVVSSMDVVSSLLHALDEMNVEELNRARH